MFIQSVRLTVMSLMLAFIAPAAKANDLACAALLCLSGGASCSNSKYPACGPSLGQYCKLLSLTKGLSKATNWLGSCKFEGSKEVVNFATVCTNQRIFSSLYASDMDGNPLIALDVPDVCKKFPQEVERQNRTVLATISLENRPLVSDISLLPVLSMRWNQVQYFDESNLSSNVVNVPVYSWNYATEIPAGFTTVYNPNTGATFKCPSRFPGDRLSFVAKIGCQ